MTSWKKPVSGSFGTPSNWDTGFVPGPGDDVSITIGVGSYTVSSSVSESILGLTVGTKKGLSITGGTFTVGSDGVSDSGVLQTTGSGGLDVTGSFSDTSGALVRIGY